MKAPNGASLIPTLFCILFLATTTPLGATVSYWDPEGFRGVLNTYSGNTLAGTWENNSWARNADGSAGPNADTGNPSALAWTEGDAAVFAVGAGATNNVGGATNTTTFTVTMNANHTVAGMFDGTLRDKSCRVAISGNGIITLPSGFDAFSISNCAADGSLAVITLNVPLTGPGTFTAQGPSGQIFLNASNSYTGGTQLGFSNQPAFTGTLNFNTNSSFGTGPIVVTTGSATAIPNLQCTNSGVTITNAVDFSQALATPAYLNIIAPTGGLTFSGPITMGGTNGFIGSGGAAANTLTLTGPIGGTAGFGKFGAGTLVLAGANTYSGGTTISAGTLRVGNGTTSGVLGSGSITDNGTLAFARSDTVTVSDTINGSGALSQAGTGTLALNAANGYSGLTAVSSGTLQLLNAGGIPAASAVQVASIATLDLNGQAATMASLSGAGNVINNNNVSGLTVSGNNTTAGGNNTTYSCLSGTLGGSGPLTKAGSSAMALRGADSFGGGVTLIGGTLSVGAAANRLPAASTLTMFPGSIFQLDANNQTLASLSGSGSVNLGGGTLTVNESGSTTFAGTIQNSELAGSSTAAGNGLRGYYYDNEDFTTLKAVRDDATVNFSSLTVTNPTTGLPPAFGTATNQVSVRWLGKLLSTSSGGNYTFTFTTDDGSRLWVNGALVIDSWVNQGATARTGSISLAASTLYDIVAEYYNDAGGASAVLAWTPPGGSSNAIPNSNLFLPGTGAFVKTGAGLLNLTGTNTFTGPTIVGAGTLEVANANGLAGSATIMVTNGSTLKLDNAGALSSLATLILNTNGGSPVVNLNYAGSLQISQLSFDGGSTFLANGTWGGTGSGAAHTSARFTGSGLLNVTPSSVCSGTNSIVSVTNGPSKNVTLTIQGTSGSQYYVVTHTNVTQPIANWTPVPNSTNTVAAPNGLWSLTITNAIPQSFYRVKAVNPCP